MAKDEIKYESFLNDVPIELVENVNSFNEQLLAMGLKQEIKPAAKGCVVSYIKDKKTIFNYVFRKNGLVARIYAENLSAYKSLLKQLPDDMKNNLTKATKCRNCNERCPKGYSFQLEGADYYICRYSFMLPLSLENFSYLVDIVKKEIGER